jgi:hypothetical protein
VEAARRRIEGEVVAAVVVWLVVLSSDDIAPEMTQQQRPDPAVCDDGDVAAITRRGSEHLFDGADDATLGARLQEHHVSKALLPGPRRTPKFPARPIPHAPIRACDDATLASHAPNGDRTRHPGGRLNGLDSLPRDQ